MFIKDLKESLKKFLTNSHLSLEYIKNLKQFYSFVDRVQKTVRTVYPDISCSKGCDRCCQHYGPTVYGIEWINLKKYLDKVKSKRLSIIREQFEEVYFPNKDLFRPDNLDNLDGMIRDKFVSLQCPFLSIEKKKCTIYKIRPLRCRVFGLFARELSSDENEDVYVPYTCKEESQRWNKCFEGAEGPIIIYLPIVEYFEEKLIALNKGKDNKPIFNWLRDYFMLKDSEF